MRVSARNFNLTAAVLHSPSSADDDDDDETDSVRR